MFKRILAMCLALIMCVGVLTLPVQTAQAATTTATVKGGWLRLRAQPSFDAVTITSYYTGTVVTVLGSSGKWYQVTTPDGRSGYMYGDYLTVNSSSSGGSSGSWENIPATVVSANGLGVRLRTGPSTAYGVLAVYPVGTSATILSSGTYWHYVRIGNRTGYMMSQFLSTGSVPSTPSESGGYIAYVTSENGLGVRLRTGPGTGYAVRGVYSVGTQVTVLKHNTTWDYIRIGTRTGYMMNKFLTTSVVTNKVTGVTLNTTCPAVGTTLQANVIPAGATVTYEWLDQNGTLLSSAPVYTVTAADTGRQIRVRVTGSGSCTGSAVSTWATVQSGSTPSTPAKTPITAVTLSNTAPTVGQTVTASTTPAGATANFVWYRDDGAVLGSGKSYTVTAADEGHAIYCAAYATGDYTGNVASYYTAKVKAAEAPAKALTGSVSLPASARTGDVLIPGVSVNSDKYVFAWTVDGTAAGSGSTLTVTEDMAGKTVRLIVTAVEGSGYTGSVTSNGCTIVVPAKPEPEPDPEPEPKPEPEPEPDPATITDM
ncbi:MAG: SH3 domain-containing protein [Aristaeellaceae bacterium]